MRLTAFTSAGLASPTLASTAFAATLLASTAATALSSGELRTHLEETLSGPLPMTLVGPISYDSLEISDDDGTLNVTIAGASYGTEDDGAALGDITMLVSEDAAGDLVARVELPKSITSDGQSYTFDSHSLFGTWSMDERTYNDFDYLISGLKVVSDDGKLGSVEGMEISLSPYAQGRQSLRMAFDTIEVADPEDDQLFSAEPSVIEMTVESPTDAEPFARMRDFVVGMADFDPDDLEDDPAATMQLFRGLTVPFSDAVGTGTLGTITYKNGLADLTVSIDGGAFNFGYENYLSDAEGTATAAATLTGIQFRAPDAAGVISEASMSAEADGMDGNFAFDFSDELYSKVLEEGAEINLGDLFNLYFNFDNANITYSLGGVSMELPDVGNIDLASGSFGVGFKDARTDDAQLLINVDEAEFAASRFNDALTSAIMPQLVDLNIAAKKLPLASLREALAEENIEASMAVGNEDEIASMFQEIGFKLLGIMMLNAPQITIETSVIDTKTIGIDLDGAFDIDPASPRFVSGGIEIVANNVEALQETIQGAMAGDDPAAKQFAVPALTGLGVAQGFGKRQDDGSLLFDVEVTSQGGITVNGAPLPLP